MIQKHQPQGFLLRTAQMPVAASPARSWTLTPEGGISSMPSSPIDSWSWA